MGVENNNYDIQDVEINHTFESWRQKTNVDIIQKLNDLKIYDLDIASAERGGVTATVEIAGGMLNIELNDIIDKGVTFTQDVVFTGGVYFENELLNINRDETPAVIMGTTAGIVIGPSIGGYTADGGETYSLNGFSGPYWLNQNGYWFTEQNLRFDSTIGTKLQFGSNETNNYLEFAGPGQGYTTDVGMSAGTTFDEIRLYNHNRDQLASVLSNGMVKITSGVNHKRINQTAHGFTFGTAIRFDGTNYVSSVAGATMGDGSDYEPKNAEVIGLVSRILDEDNFDVTFSGEIHGDFSGVIGTSDLSPGCVYYLSTTGEGALSSSQPSGLGLSYDKVVSKPVMYAVGETAGIFAHFRGQVIVPDSAIVALYGASGGEYGTADVYNTHRIAINNTHGFTSGDVISRSTTDVTGYTLASALDENARSVLGIAGVEDTAANTITIITSGLITNNDNVDFNVNNGPAILGLDGGLTSDTEDFYNNMGGDPYWKPIATILDGSNAVVHVGGVQNDRPEELTSYSATTPTNTTGKMQNYLTNGSLYYWRRGNGVGSAMSSANQYFADRWKCVSGSLSGATRDFSIQKQSFNDYQTSVPGFPDYYANVKGAFVTGGAGSTSGHYHRIDQRLEGSTKFSDRVMSFSFYHKGSVAGGTMGVSFIRSADGSAETRTDLGTFSPTTSWTKYKKTFAAPAGITGTSNNAYSAMSVYFTDQDNGIEYAGTLSVAQFKLEDGDGSVFYNEIDRDEELRKCEYYYQTSYNKDCYPGTVTLLNTQKADASSFDIVAANSSEFVCKFPHKMRTNPSVKVWGPNGEINQGFNRTANRSMKNASGTKGFNGVSRISTNTKSSINSIGGTDGGMMVKLLQGYVPLDILTFHYEADAEL